MLAQHRKVKEVGDMMIEKPTIKALVRGDCNYNCSKVVNFHVE